MGTARLEGGAGAAEFFEFLEDLHLGKSVFEGDDALVDESRQILVMPSFSPDCSTVRI